MQVVAQLTMQDLPDNLRVLSLRACKAQSEPLVLADDSTCGSLPRWGTR